MRQLLNLGFKVVEALNARASLVGPGPFFDPRAFPWAPPIEAGWSAARAELDALLADRGGIPPLHEVSPGQEIITSDTRWRTYFLFAFGRPLDENCRRCPATAALLRGIPGLSHAFFSILEPGKHIPAHRGPYNGVLRFHLGLRVPDQPPACRITVGGETRGWREGGSLFFDDTFVHEVWNDTGADRVVIFADFLRPLPFPVSLLNRLCLRIIHRPRVVKEALAHLAAWNDGREGRASQARGAAQDRSPDRR